MNPDLAPRLSVVFPVYNESQTIEKTLRAYHGEFFGKVEFEMIVAEDGSTDSTKDILTRLAPELSLKIFLCDERKGYLRAVKDALRHAQYEWIFLSDSDHQFDPHDFWKLWQYRDEYDIIVGKKTNRQDGLLRLFLSRGYNFLLRLGFGVPYVDMDTGFRLFRKKVVDELADSVHHLGFFTAEFIIKAHLRGYRVHEEPVAHFRQQVRASNIFHIRRLPRIIGRELKAIMHFFFDMRRRDQKTTGAGK